MAAFTEITGTSAIGATEWSLATNTSYSAADAQTSAGYLSAMLDLSDMIAGDQLQVRIYEKVRSGDSQLLMFEAVLVGGQSQPIWLAPAIPVKNGWDVSVTALAGTVTVNWSLRLGPMS